MDRFVGKRLDGRYEIREVIGVGGMAVVYKAYDNVEDRIVAMKILKDEFVSNEEFIRRFKNESKAIAVLSHPNIVKVYDVCFGDVIQYIVMEYIDGITLKEYIEREGSLRWQDAVYFTIQILKGLQHAHDKGIVHRDVKPQNIMVLPDGTIKVTDFGIARFARSEQRTITDKAIGSVHYISPEQARGEKTDEKTDIYSVGVMLYEMLTGRLPFEADSAVSVAIMQLQREPELPRSINPSIPLGLEQITMHAMQKSTERRYQSAAEMLCDLEVFKKDPSATFDYSYFVDDSPTKFIGGANASLNSNTGSENSEEKAKSKTIPILAGIAATLVVVGIIIFAIFFRSIFGSKNKTKEIECENFVGMTMSEIEEKSDMYKNRDKDGYNYKFVQVTRANDEYPINQVYDQSPKAGKKIKAGAKITLYISLGEATQVMPDLRNHKAGEASSTLSTYDVKVEIVKENNSEIQEGYVIRTEPKQGTAITKGEVVKVYVSSGKAEVKINVPDLVGLSEESAKAELTKEGLLAQVKTENIPGGDKYYKAGYVFKQDPKVGSAQLSEGATVTIYVSTGKVDYKNKVTVGLTDTNNFKAQLAIYSGNKQLSISNELDFSNVSSYTFTLSTSNETESYTVKICAKDGKTYKYQDIDFNSKTGEATVVATYNEWKTLLNSGN